MSDYEAERKRIHFIDSPYEDLRTETTSSISFDKTQQAYYTDNGKYPVCWGCIEGFSMDTTKPIVAKMFETYKNKKGTINDYTLCQHLRGIMIREYDAIGRPVPDWSVGCIYNHIRRHMRDAFTLTTNNLADCTTMAQLMLDNITKHDPETNENICDLDTVKTWITVTQKQKILLADLKNI
jgi:hypothetical protein